eukprot:4705594-Pyramimonas_sp.AAC.1
MRPITRASQSWPPQGWPHHRGGQRFEMGPGQAAHPSQPVSHCFCTRARARSRAHHRGEAAPCGGRLVLLLDGGSPRTRRHVS